MGSSEGGKIGRVGGVYRKGRKPRGWSLVFLLDDMLLIGGTNCPRSCSGGHANATGGEEDGVGHNDTLQNFGQRVVKEIARGQNGTSGSD